MFFLQTDNIVENGTGISLGATVGIVVAGAFVIFLVLGILWWKCCLGQKNKMEQGTCKAINIVIIFFSNIYIYIYIYIYI
jgi:hypothetical protein